MTNGDLLRAVNRQFTIKSQNALAEALGVFQQYVNKILKVSPAPERREKL